MLAACSRSEQWTAYSIKPDASSAASAILPPVIQAPPPELPAFTPLGVCNRLLADGAATRCYTPDGGTTTNFTNGRAIGTISIARDRAHYERVLNEMHFDGLTVATSERALAIVFWKGGDELADLKIRNVVAGLGL